MRSKAAISGHPIHPMLVAVPIGLFVWALVANLIYLGSDNNRTWYDISYYSSIAGIVAGLIAAIPGAIDGLTIGRESEARGSVVLHGLLNVVVLGLFGASALLMMDGNAIQGSDGSMAAGLQAVAVGLLALSGWIGGEMVFRDHLAMIPEDSEVAEDELRRHGRIPTGGRPATRAR